jgi:hypothetical protein
MRLCLASLLVAAIAACSGSDSTPAPDAPPQSSGLDPQLVDWVKDSGWVFRAKVVELRAATEPTPPDFADPDHVWNLDHMIVIEVEQASTEPLTLPTAKGRHDTVILAGNADAFAVGDEVYLFATLFQAGNSVVYREIGRLPGSLPFADVHRAVHQSKRYWIDRALADRLTSATRVIEARVEETRDVPGPAGDEIPDWWEATLSPFVTLAGTPSIDPVTVRFDAAQNFSGYQAPKLTTGDHALFLLQPDTVTGLPDAATVVIDPLDRQVLGERERIRSLLAVPPVRPL